MQREYITPAGEFSRLYMDMTQQMHVLIAGAAGSGKSVVINGIIHAALYSSPVMARFIMIDLKRVELSEYKRLPHIEAYADTVQGAINALKHAIVLTESRYADMQRRKLRKYDGSHMYVIIDELADLMTTAKRQVMPLLQRICQIGRAARVHVIAATQCPLSAVIPTPIKVNFDAIVGLRTRSAQDSRNILGRAGCENLPRYGMGYYMTPEGFDLYPFPMVADSERQRLIKYWSGKAGKGKRIWFRR